MITLKRFKEGTWFDFPGPEKIRFKIRPITTSAAMELRSLARKRVAIQSPDGDSEKIEYVEDLDTGHYTLLIFDHALQDIEGIKFEEEDGTEVADLKIKKRMVYDHQPFRDFVVQKATDLREAEDKRIREERKNLYGSQVG